MWTYRKPQSFGLKASSILELATLAFQYTQAGGQGMVSSNTILVSLSNSHIEILKISDPNFEILLILQEFHSLLLQKLALL